MKRLAVAAATALLALALVSPALGTPAGAAAVPEPTVTLLGQPAFVHLGDDAVFRLAIDGPTEGLEVRAVIYRYSSSRLAFERTTRGERLGSPLATAAAPVATLPVAPEGGRTFTVPLQDPDLPRDPNRIRVAMPSTVDAGVYPVSIELWNPDRAERVSGFVTQMVALANAPDGTPVGARLRVAWVWQVAAATATEPDGKLREGFRHSVAPGGRLDGIADALAGARTVPVTLAVRPETASAWRRAAQLDPPSQAGLTALRNAAQTHQVLSEPYVAVDPVALEGAGLGTGLDRELAAGRAALGATLAVETDPRTSAMAPLDTATLGRLQRAGVQRLVVAPGALAPDAAADQYTPARPFTLTSGSLSFPAVQTNDDLARLLTGPGSAALRAQRFLAGLSVVALEQPSQERGVVVDTPTRWAPDPATLTAVLAGLTGNPLLAPTSLDDIFTQVPPAGGDDPRVRTLASVSARPAPVTAASFFGTERQLDALASMIGAQDPTIARGREALLLSLADAAPEPVARRRGTAQLAGIDATVHDFATGVQAPQGRTVTLTSRTAEIPVSLLNTTGRPVDVRVRLESQKLTFPDGPEQVLTLQPRNTTLRFTVEARASGTFPLRVSVTSEDGVLALQQARYTVRSTVVSGMGIFLTISAGLFLAIWWVTHWRKSRRRPVTALTS